MVWASPLKDLTQGAQRNSEGTETLSCEAGNQSGPHVCAAAVGLYVLTIAVLGLTLCRDHQDQMLYSPSRNYRAEVEESDCGAVSGFNTDVIIRKRPFVLSHLPLGTASGE